MYWIRHLSPVWSRKRPEFDVELSGATLASGKESAIWQGLAPPGVIFRPLQQTLSWFTGSAGAIVASERRPFAMDDKLRQDIASFRYSLISPIVSRQDLRPGRRWNSSERRRRATAIPGSCRTQVGERTIQRHLALYREGGLMPSCQSQEIRGQGPEGSARACGRLKRESPRRDLDHHRHTRVLRAGGTWHSQAQHRI